MKDAAEILTQGFIKIFMVKDATLILTQWFVKEQIQEKGRKFNIVVPKQASETNINKNKSGKREN